MAHSDLVLTLGGVAIFILGLTIASQNLEKLAADRIRQIVTVLARQPVYGVGLGVALTLILQSSGAVTSLLVGLGSAGVVSLSQVMSVILGTAIGSTITVQVLSFNIAQFGLPVFALAFFVQFLSRRRGLNHLASAVMGFGLVFYGLEVIQMGTLSLRDFEGFTSFVEYLRNAPLMAMLLTAVFTSIVHSSAVTISIGMTLALHGTISLEDSMFWIYGANIGTTATALLAAAGGNYIGRQVAWAHALYKVAGVALFYFFTPYFVDFFASGSPARDVANLNTIYNLVSAVLFFPFINWGAKFVERIFAPRSDEVEFSVKFLSKRDWQNPAVVVAYAEREVLRMADIVLAMIEDSLGLFKLDDPDRVERIRRNDDRADLLARELNLYLAQQMESAPESLREQMLRMMYFVTDLEAAADVVDNQLLELAQKKHNLKVDFSKEGWAELSQLFHAVVEVAQMSVACFQSQDKDLAARVIFHKRTTRKLEQRYRESHMSRLVKGTPESLVTSSIHLDVLGEYRRIVGLMSNHVYGLLKDTDPYGLLPRRE